MNLDGWPSPLIDQARCTGCGLCAEACPTGALALRDRRPVIVNPLACVYTGHCELICPEGAINRPFQIVFGEPNEE